MNRIIFDDQPECTSAPDLFFPSSTGSKHAMECERAKSICRRCPFRVPCLAWALEYDEWGIWGGTTHEERHGVTAPAKPQRMTRYQLYAATQKMIDEGLSLRECAQQLGYTYSHVCETRRMVAREIDAGRYRP